MKGRINLVRHKWVITVSVALLVLAVIGLRMYAQAQADAPVVVLTLGEPWEDVRKNSTAEVHAIFGAEIGASWFRVIPSDARMRFVDPQYGFETPRARFFTVGFGADTKVTDVRMSPQVETLPLDEALKVVIDLQNQWERGGWKLTLPHKEPRIEDTPQWRTKLREINEGGRNFWQAENKFQIMLTMHRFADDNHPNEERYLITLALAKPWVEAREDEAQQELGK